MKYSSVQLKTISGQTVSLNAPVTLEMVLAAAEEELKFARRTIKVKIHDRVEKLIDLILAHSEEDISHIWEELRPATDANTQQQQSSRGGKGILFAKEKVAPNAGDTIAAAAPAPLAASSCGKEVSDEENEIITIMVFGARDKYANGLTSSTTGEADRNKRGETMGALLGTFHPIPFPLCPIGFEELYRIVSLSVSDFFLAAYCAPVMQYMVRYISGSVDRLSEVIEQIANNHESLYTWIYDHPHTFLRLLNYDESEQRYALLVLDFHGDEMVEMEMQTCDEHMELDFDVEDGHTLITVLNAEDEDVAQLIHEILEEDEEGYEYESNADIEIVEEVSIISSEQTPSTSSSSSTTFPVSEDGVDVQPRSSIFHSIAREEISAAPPTPDDVPYLDIKSRMSYVLAIMESHTCFWQSASEAEEQPAVSEQEALAVATTGAVDTVKPDTKELVGKGKVHIGSTVLPSVRELRDASTAIVEAHHRVQEISVMLIEELGKSLLFPESKKSFLWFLRMCEGFFCDAEEFYISIAQHYIDTPQLHPLRASLRGTFDGPWHDRVHAFACMAAISRLLVLDAVKQVLSSSDEPNSSSRLRAVRQLPSSDLLSLRWMTPYGARGLLEALMNLSQRQSSPVVLYCYHAKQSASSETTDVPSHSEEGGMAYVVNGPMGIVQMSPLSQGLENAAADHEAMLRQLLQLACGEDLTAELRDEWNRKTQEAYRNLLLPIETFLSPPATGTPSNVEATNLYVVDARLAPSFLSERHRSSEAAAFNPGRLLAGYRDEGGVLVLEKWSVCVSEHIWHLLYADETAMVWQESGGITKQWNSLLLSSSDQPPSWLGSDKEGDKSEAQDGDSEERVDIQLRLGFHQQNMRSKHLANTAQHYAILHEATPQASSSRLCSNPLRVSDLHVIDEFSEPSSTETLRHSLSTSPSCKEVLNSFPSLFAETHPYQALVVHNGPFQLPDGETSIFQDLYEEIILHPGSPVASIFRSVLLKRLANHPLASWVAVECSLLDYGGVLPSLALLQRPAAEAAASLVERSDAQYVDDYEVAAFFEKMVDHMLVTRPAGEVEALDDLIGYLEVEATAAQQRTVKKKNPHPPEATQPSRQNAQDA